jgi:K+-transporting ATPase ATPase C chain
MNNFLKQIRIAIVATLVFAIVVSGLYPFAVWALGRVFFPSQAGGSLITNKQGTVIGSSLIGQQFTLPQYFHSRPSAAGQGYDSTASGGSNLGPTSQKLADQIKQRIADYRTENNLATSTEVPGDAVTASGSGLDPEISLANANIQVTRVAKARLITVAQVQDLIKQNTEGRSLGVLGEPGVNVLTLNIALDQKYPIQK